MVEGEGWEGGKEGREGGRKEGGSEGGREKRKGGGGRKAGRGERERREGEGKEEVGGMEGGREGEEGEKEGVGGKGGGREGGKEVVEGEGWEEGLTIHCKRGGSRVSAQRRNRVISTEIAVPVLFQRHCLDSEVRNARLFWIHKDVSKFCEVVGLQVETSRSHVTCYPDTLHHKALPEGHRHVSRVQIHLNNLCFCMGGKKKLTPEPR